jgi:predicted chitinase
MLTLRHAAHRFARKRLIESLAKGARPTGSCNWLRISLPQAAWGVACADGHGAVRVKAQPHPENTSNAPRPDKPRPAAPAGASPTTNQGVIPTAGKDESGASMTKVDRPVPDKITLAQLQKVAIKNNDGPSDAYLQSIADELNTDLPKYKLDTAVRRAHFFGQILQEAGGALNKTEENLNYSVASLNSTFKSYYASRPKEAQADGYIKAVKATKTTPAIAAQSANHEVIANKAYGKDGVGKTLGNTEVGDGWKYRGRGLKQVTGRYNYKKFTDEYEALYASKVDFIATPDFLATMPYSVRSAVWFWVANKCWEKADLDAKTGIISDPAVDAVTKIVNAGMNGKEARRTNVNRAHSAFT